MATLRWSVWNPVSQRYAVYASQGLGRDPAVPPSPPFGSASAAAGPHGAAPEALMPSLPLMATKIGDSAVPVGRIAQAGMSWGSILVAAGAAYLGWRWWKRRKRK